ncbi:zinc transport system substrate-binding protein [Paenochrobactrum gallinarii]|uniref:High-affinity zinc uptake system protein ZnuA n=2 Tax=Paenochrobactrum gallinarii TaxID=643673 RepID=A0A841M5B7_9HYPH|nr:zinc transport system substrate-binding protein [Paenochrobactrum gallinarii]
MRKFLMASVLCAGTALAIQPSYALTDTDVVVSIKPLHSLVSAVMKDVAEPQLIVKGAGSGHTYSLKPSDAKMLENAKLIFWTGPSMEMFLSKPLETLGTKAQQIMLGEVSGLTTYGFREGGAFEGHDHGDGEHDHGNNNSSIHEHEHEHGHGHGHDHSHEHGHDAHIWLDPSNGETMVEEIANVLSEADPANAKTYHANADSYKERIAKLDKELKDELAPVKAKPFVVFHDAYQYFEKRYGLNTVGSITVSPENAPGAARIKEIHDKIVSLNAVCVFSEPQFESRLLQTVIDGTSAKTGILDPLGAELKDGPDLYLNLLRDLAVSLNKCLN